MKRGIIILRERKIMRGKIKIFRRVKIIILIF